MVQESPEMTTSEWELMRIIWTKGKATSSEVSDLIQGKKAWTESTVKTLLRRLVNKRALATEKEGRRFIYLPQVTETEAMDQMTSETFARICAMKKGQELVKLLTETPLSQNDITEMQDILKQKAKTAPSQVACDCLADRSQCQANGCCQ
nr:CopY/TcrY family copper transport repressor [Ligilactobacillus salitolerans]